MGGAARDGVPVLSGPARTIELALDAEGQAQMLPGEPKCAVVTDVDAINLWELMVRLWPEVVGGLMLLLLLAWFLRTWRRGRCLSPGHLYCRRCHYCLTGLRGETCVECGLSLARRRPISRRSPRIRCGLAVVLMLAVVAAYLSQRTSLPRSGAVSRWRQWWSVSLADFAKARKIQWLSQYSKECDRIIVIDCRDGRVVDDLLTRRSLTSLELDRRHKRLLGIEGIGTGGEGESAIVAVDLARGSCRQLARFVSGSGAEIGPTGQGRRLPYLLYTDRPDDPPAWFTVSPEGALCRVDEVDTDHWFFRQDGSVPVIAPVQTDPYDLVVATRLGKAPSFTYWRPESAVGSDLMLVDEGGGARTMLADDLPILDMAVAIDERTLVTAVRDEGIMRWDLDRPGDPPRLLMGDRFGRRVHEFRITPDGRRLLALIRPPSDIDEFRVLDLDEPRWTVSFSVLENAQEFLISDDGRFAVIVCSSGKLLVYVLPVDG